MTESSDETIPSPATLKCAQRMTCFNVHQRAFTTFWVSFLSEFELWIVSEAITAAALVMIRIIHGFSVP
jgi:hypothetical protein